MCIERHTLSKLIQHKYDIFLLNAKCKHLQYSVDKVCEPLGLITGWASFCCNNLNQIRPAQQSGGILDHSSLQNCFSSAIFLGCLVWIALMRSCHSIAIGLSQDSYWAIPEALFFFSFESILMLIYFMLWVIVLLRHPSSVELKLVDRWS